MQKGYKREGRGMAVLRCFIGLFVMVFIILLAGFMLRLDYSDKLDPNASIRPYVEITPSPVPTATPAVTEAPAVIEATAVVTSTPAPTAVATAVPTEAPTAEPTAEPTPEVTATPEPTKIPSSAVSQLKFSGYKLPSLSSKDAELGITYSHRSEADNNKYLHLQGYAYINDSGYNGENAELYLVIVRSTGHTALALPTKVAGISGGDHADAACANAAASDFEAIIDVSQFPDDSYTLGMVFVYTDSNTGKTRTEYLSFPSEMSFSVLSKAVVSDVKTVAAE